MNDRFYQGELPMYVIENELYLPVQELSEVFELEYDIKGIGAERILIVNKKRLHLLNLLRETNIYRLSP